ncbi:MAG: T9SS type A sorting domain-containing protein, partial [Candidatus Eisenbacteria bacterium]|nr:T9SS type A sorting domain-containing protein [Candidatus Eisenbacteria bacterium]
DPAATPDPLASSNARILGTRPNPMRSTTELTYDVSSVAAASPVTLRLSDPTGRIVRTLVDGKMGAGTHHASWDGRDDAGRPVCTGVYLVHFSSLDGQSTAKLVLVK